MSKFISSVYTGVLEDANKFYYKIKIDQKLSDNGKEFFICSALFMPCFYSDSDWKTHKRAINSGLEWNIFKR